MDKVVAPPGFDLRINLHSKSSLPVSSCSCPPHIDPVNTKMSGRLSASAQTVP
jgi:hypothetical protein